MNIYIDINTLHSPYQSRLPYQPETQSRDDMGRGMKAGMI